MAKRATQTGQSSPNQRLLAAMSYVWVLFVFPLLLGRGNDFVQHHARQGIVLFVFEIITILLALVPFFGWFIFAPLGTFASVIFAVAGAKSALEGKMWNMPFLGAYARRMKI